MAHCEIEPGSYMNSDAVEKVINYCVRPTEDGKVLIGGIGVDASNAKSAIDDFYKVKEFYGKLEGRQVRHYHVSFDKSTEKFSPEEALYKAYDIAEYYGKEYQTFFSVHTDTDNLHIHFCSNTVSYSDGHMYRDGADDLKSFREFVSQIIDKK